MNHEVNCPYCGVDFRSRDDEPCRNMDAAVSCHYFVKAPAGAAAVEAVARHKHGGLDGFGTRRTLHPMYHSTGQRAYFAHAMSDYGTAREAAVVEAIRDQLGPEVEVVNPNHPDHERGYEAAGRDFKYWTDLASSCGTVVYMPLPHLPNKEPMIGSGVWKEVESALAKDRLVYEVCRESPHRLERVARLYHERLMSVDETRRWTPILIALRDGL